MSYFIIQETLKCGQCGAADFEYVTRGPESFTRCCNCGHEGNKKSLIPKSESGALSSIVAEKSKERTF